VVGTPGRIADLLRSRRLRMDGVRTLVLDEADQATPPATRENTPAREHSRALIGGPAVLRAACAKRPLIGAHLVGPDDWQGPGVLALEFSRQCGAS
jgi:hypothetical protein